MRQWLRLVRFSGIATVFGNMTAAITVAVYSDGLSPLMVLAPLQRNFGQALWVIIASIGLYFTGMLWNDIADSERDARLHPGRPLPSGALNRSAVWMVGLFLPVITLLAAAQCGWRGLSSAGIVLSWALIYNLSAKHVPLLGAVCMGAVRSSYSLFALLLLGNDYFDRMVLSLLSMIGYGPASELGSLTPIYPVLIFIYISAVTYMSELESRRGNRLELLLAGSVIGVCIAIALGRGLVWSHWIRAFIEEHDMMWAVAGLIFMVLLAVLLCSRLVPPWWHAVQSGKKQQCHRWFVLPLGE